MGDVGVWSKRNCHCVDQDAAHRGWVGDLWVADEDKKGGGAKRMVS